MPDMPESIILTNMCMIYNEDSVVVQNRVEGEWCGIAFPGGHVDPGESCTDSVIREIMEETGLTIRAPHLCGIKDWVNPDGARYMVLLYKTNQFEGSLTSSEEGEVFWAKRDELTYQQLAEDMGDLLKVFTDDELSEFFYFEENGKWMHALK